MADKIISIPLYTDEINPTQYKMAYVFIAAFGNSYLYKKEGKME